MGSYCLMDREFLFGVMKISEKRYSDGCTTMCMQVTSLTGYLTIVKMANFMLYVFYIFHNWGKAGGGF